MSDSKAQPDLKAEHTRQYSSILNRFATQLSGMRAAYKTAFSRWVTAILSVSHWLCQRFGFCAATVFVWSFFWLKYGWHRIYYRQFYPCLFCEIVWLQRDLFLSLASIFLLIVKIDGVSNCGIRLTPPENAFNQKWACNII